MYLINKNNFIGFKRFVRIMNIIKQKNNVYYVSILISSKRPQFIEISEKEYKVFKNIDGTKRISQIIETEKLDEKNVFDFLKRLNNLKILETSTEELNVKKRNIYDRHDLFFDMCFEFEEFTNNLLNKTILIIGCGGIGNNLVSSLSRSGIKKFILLDDDIIEETNLTRQFLFNTNDINKYKVDIIEKRLKEFDSNINVIKIKSTLQDKEVFDLLKKHKIDFAFCSADTPQTIAIDVYKLCRKLKIPFTTVGYLNDFGIYGPIIDEDNIRYEHFISFSENNNNVIKNINKRYQAPSFGPLNSFISSLAIFDLFKYFNNKYDCKTYNVKRIINFNTLENQDIDFKSKIGVFNLSSNLSYKFQDRVKSTLKIFELNKLSVELGKLTFNKGDYRSGSVKDRVDEFNSLLKDSNIMLSMIGGFNTSSTLRYIDYETIKMNGIKVVGCSDTTALLLAIYKITNQIVYYGPSFLMSYNEQKYIKEFNINQFIDVVINDFSSNKIFLPEKVTIERVDWSLNKIKEKKLIKNKIEFINNLKIEEIQGRLIGGNLNTMASLVGTEFMPEIKEGDILFIEDSYVNASITERNISVLKNSGILDKVSVIIIGLIESYDDEGSNRKHINIIQEFLDNDIPIINNFPCSHIQPSIILKIGATIKINFDKKTFEYVKK